MPNKLLLQEFVCTLRKHHYSIPEHSHRLWPPPIRGFSVKDWEQVEESVAQLEVKFGMDKLNPIEREKFYRLLTECVYAKLSQARSDSFLSESIKETLHKVEGVVEGELLQEVQKLYAKIAKLNKKPGSIGVQAMLVGLKQPELAIEFGYPGYLKSGLIPIILKMTKGELSENHTRRPERPQKRLRISRTTTVSGN